MEEKLDYKFVEGSDIKPQIKIYADQPHYMDKDRLSISKEGDNIEFCATVDRCGCCFLIPKKELIRLMEKL